MVWRAARCLRPCDRVLSPPLAIFLHLEIRRNETSHSSHYSLPIEVKSDGVEGCKVPETL